MPAAPTVSPPDSPWPRVAAAAGLLTVIISVVLVAFAWPAARAKAHDVPIAIAGPPAAARQVAAALAQRLPDGFDVTVVAGTAAAEALIRDRAVYGAIDVSTGRPQVLIASAASTVVAQTLQGVATGLAQGTGATAVPVRDLAALSAKDPRGAGLSAGSLPLVMGGMLGAALLGSMVVGVRRRMAGVALFAVTGGLAMTAILQFWLGSLSGNYLVNTGAVAISIAATAFTVMGLQSLLGMAGTAIGGVTMMLVGNPLSGMTSAPEMLPGWFGQVGQLLPPGAAGTLLRSVAFFGGHGAGQAIAVLLVWMGAGLALCTVAIARTRRPAVSAEPIAEPAAQPMAAAA
jgi:hypothetical protein